MGRMGVVQNQQTCPGVPLVKGVGLVENCNTKCIFGGLGGGYGVGGGVGCGANNFQAHLHT